ncbi:hypothetical protein D3C86_2108000 [compost metagenome]
MLAILGCRHAGGLLKASKQSALFKIGLRGEYLQSRFLALSGLQPMLHFQHGRIAVEKFWREHTVVTLFSTGGVY